MEKQDYINYWVTGAERDLSSMEANFNSGKYDWSLFIGHLVLEKILKALWVKNNEDNIAPKIHNLVLLAEKANHPITENEKILLLEINSFNLETRYPDYKFEFFKECTREFAASYILKIKDFYTCILKLI
jgi:HEPN domain-containing protein